MSPFDLKRRIMDQRSSYRSINWLSVDVSPGLCFLASALHNMTTIRQQTSCSLDNKKVTIKPSSAVRPCLWVELRI
jgi:hypothetical protein